MEDEKNNIKDPNEVIENEPIKKMVSANSGKIPEILTVLPLYSLPIFPGLLVPITISNENIFPELDKKLKVGNFIVTALIKKEFENVSLAEITPQMLYKFGTLGNVVKKIFLPNGSVNILFNSFRRVEIEEFVSQTPILEVGVRHIREREKKEDLELKVLTNTLADQMDYIGKNNPFMAEQVRTAIQNSESPSRVADFVASIMGDVPKESLQDILETINVRDRLEKIAILMAERINMIKLQEKIMDQINNKTEQQQRDFFLREQLKAIKKELGNETDKQSQDIERFNKRFDAIKESVPAEVTEKIKEEIEKLQSTDQRSPDYALTLNYLELTLALPWIEKNEENLNLEKSKKLLEESHYGIQDIKDRILEFLAVRKLKPDSKGAVICFVGPPGVGKTSLGKAIAEALNRPFFRFSVGGMRDEAEIKGHRRTYIGAMPGKIIQGLKIAKTLNPVFMIDEIDKMGANYQGDPASALLEVLDPEQNINFRDNYVDLPFDLSHTLFLTTANTLSTIPAPLLDRMEIIRLSGYIAEEKYMIGKTYILEKQKKAHGLEPNDLTLTKGAFIYIAEKYSREAGVRNFEQQISKLCRKIAFKKAMGEPFNQKIDSGDLPSYLGAEIFEPDERKLIKKPGIVIGLAWTSMGGDTLYIESILLPSKAGGLKLSGQLGNVMQESANIAYSYIRSIAKKHHINAEIFENNTIHLHVPAGAVPKDGPSAGTTMAACLYSLIKDIQFPKDFAMTGELTLTGTVLPIGGLKEKSIAALRAGIKNIIAPLKNKKDLEEIPLMITKQINYHFVSTLEEVLDILFRKQRKKD